MKTWEKNEVQQYVIHNFHTSNGNSFLCHAPIENVIVGNVLKESSTSGTSLKFFDINTQQETRFESLLNSMAPAIGGASGDRGKNNKNSKNSINRKNSKNKKDNINNNNVEINERKHGLSRDLCLYVMSRLTTMTFQKETNFRFIPSNCYVIYYLLFFQSIRNIDCYLRCKTRFQHGMLCCFLCVCFYF